MNGSGKSDDCAPDNVSDRQTGRVSTLRGVLNDLFDVLHGRDQVILDALPPEPPIAGAFEMMILSCLSKAAFNERHPAAAIPLGLAAACFGPTL